MIQGPTRSIMLNPNLINTLSQIDADFN